jgi:1,4-dihydroxy-2-naphthoate octaprenyltransferase
LKRLALASRIAFFPASVVPVLVGSAWGYRVAGHLDWVVAALALVATLCVHLGANVLNDVGDEICGTDRINDERIFPYTGGSRFIQNGVMSLPEMTRYGIVLLGASVIPGIALVVLRGPTVLLFGVVGVLLGVLYSLPRVQLVGRGMGEAVIAVAFGVLPVSGAAWLQSGRLDWAALLISLPVGLWVADILLMNEVPDARADAQVGKRTLVVRFGTAGTRRIYFGVQLTAVCAVLLAGFLRLVPWWIAVLALLILPGAWSAARGIREGADRATLTRSIELTLRLHTAGGALLVVAAVLGKLLYSN